MNCPCCGFPTLTKRADDEICGVCGWQDDGQDDPRADEVWGGPNRGYSLNVARANFRSHGHMFAAGEGIRRVEQPSPERLELLGYVGRVRDGIEELDFDKLARLIEQDADTQT